MAEPAAEFDGQRWSLAVFSSREAPSRLNEVVAAAANADRGGAALAIDVLVNGNAALAGEMRARLSAGTWWKGTTTVRLWSMPQPDKAHAWNHYLHALMPETDLAFFLDGYVRIESDALALIADAMRKRPQALAATSVPSCGRSSQALRRLYLEEGGLHGNFFALTGTAARRLRSSGIRLPRGIYRNDSALGAVLAFDLDPARNRWSWDRIAVVADARYDAPVASPGRPSDWRAAAKRRLRQAQGDLETRALKAYLADAKRSPSEWPSTSRELVLQWAAERRKDARSLMWADPLAWLTLQRLRRQHDDGLSNGRVECLGHYARAIATTEQSLPVSEH